MLQVFKKSNSHKIGVFQQLLVIICVAVIITHCHKLRNGTKDYRRRGKRTTFIPYTNKACISVDLTLRARHKTCFLRPDSGPCRADILQWYYDVKQHRCYRFFWGGCQGNGNRFETKEECLKYCYLENNEQPSRVPHFCSLVFEFGTCFGQYHRWAWDSHEKSCKRHLYSGCGGNQNNFESQMECVSTCLTPPHNTLERIKQFTTCFPYDIPELQ